MSWDSKKKTVNSYIDSFLASIKCDYMELFLTDFFFENVSLNIRQSMDVASLNTSYLLIRIPSLNREDVRKIR